MALDLGYCANLRSLRSILQSTTTHAIGRDLRVSSEVLAYIDYLASNLNKDKFLALDKIKERGNFINKAKIRFQAYMCTEVVPKQTSQPEARNLPKLESTTSSTLQKSDFFANWLKASCADNVNVNVKGTSCLLLFLWNLCPHCQNLHSLRKDLQSAVWSLYPGPNLYAVTPGAWRDCSTLTYKETEGRVVILQNNKSILSKAFNPSKFDYIPFDLEKGGPSVSFDYIILTLLTDSRGPQLVSRRSHPITVLCGGQEWE